MKKFIFLLIALLAVNSTVFGQSNKVIPTAWYNAAGTAITALGSSDTAYTTAVDFFPFDSAYINIAAIFGDTLGFVVKCQWGDASSNGSSWSAITNLTAAGAADTVGYTTAATNYTGKSFTFSVAANGRAKSPKLRFVIIGTSLTGRLNGVAAEKWLTDKQTKILLTKN